ncbi:hypothetical protein RJT34_04856 [Clitoria ternatea]|uniref:Dehydrin n=1 Tax=Clitoria ternatea TaxID=43366 RepID=A0AAN9KPT9_CLITE
MFPGTLLFNSFVLPLGILTNASLYMEKITESVGPQIMAHYQNQYGAVPASSKDPIQKEMESGGDTTGTGVGGGGGSAQVIADDYGTNSTTTAPAHAHADAGKAQHHKKGIIDKIKDKLPGPHHHNK